MRPASSGRHVSKIIFSGIQPTGVPHLGNYIGALRPWVETQRSEPATTKIIISVVDLHAITVPQHAGSLRQSKKQMLASLLAMGLDPCRCIIYEQSRVPEHNELAWILGTLTPMGSLARMTQWKAKSGSTQIFGSDHAIATPGLHLGLFAYPVLQAADVLLYKTTHVPVGDDQAQHLELCRDLAKLFNKRYNGDILPLPQTVLRENGARISSLREPGKKMSKSDPNDRSRINLTDSAGSIRKKIASAVTDSQAGISYDPGSRPGIANLIDIMAAFTGETPRSLASSIAALSHRELKEATAETIINALSPIHEHYSELIQDERMLEQIALEGAERASEIARHTMREVRKVVGLS
ncbi:Tryptophan--tRNA ligase, mitochondrial [Savitreella phatthalungensis]